MENKILKLSDRNYWKSSRLESPEEPKCRICYSNSEKEHFISPCRCKGSVGMVHHSCLQRWLQIKKSQNCELCATSFLMIHTPKSFQEWFSSSASGMARKHLITHLVIFVVFTGTLIGAQLADEATSNDKTTSCLACPLIKFGPILIYFLLFFYLVLLIRYQYSLFAYWKKNNWNIRLADYPTVTEDRKEIDISRMFKEINDVLK